MKEIGNYLVKELEDALYQRVNPTDAMHFNYRVVMKLREAKILPQRKMFSPELNVDQILMQLKGREKESLNIIGFKTPYDDYKPFRNRQRFEKMIGFNVATKIMSN